MPVPPTAQGIADCREQIVAGSAQAETAADMAFPVLAEAMFRWALDAAGIRSGLKNDPIDPPLVTQGALAESSPSSSAAGSTKLHDVQSGSLLC